MEKQDRLLFFSDFFEQKFILKSLTEKLIEKSGIKIIENIREEFTRYICLTNLVLADAILNT